MIYSTEMATNNKAENTESPNDSFSFAPVAWIFTMADIKMLNPLNMRIVKNMSKRNILDCFNSLGFVL